MGEEEGTSLPETQLEDSGVNKKIVLVVWAAAYGISVDIFRPIGTYLFDQPLGH